MKLLSLLWVPKPNRAPIRVYKAPTRGGGYGQAAADFGFKYATDKQFRAQVNTAAKNAKDNGIALYQGAKNTFRKVSESIQDGKSTFTSAKTTMHTPVLSISGQITRSEYKDARREPSFYKKLVSTGASLSFENNTSRRYASGSGSQLSFDFGYNAIPQLNFMNNAVATQISSGGNSNYARTTSWFLRKTVVKSTYTNAGLNGIDLKICEVVRRNDNVGPYNTSLTGISNYNTMLEGPNAFWGVITGTESQVGLSVPQQSTIGNVPNQYRVWNKYFKIVKCYPVTLQAGASHVHTSTYMPYSSIGGDLLTPYSETISSGLYNGGFSGITRYIMVIFNGMPVHASNDLTIVSLGQAALNIVSSTNTTLDFYNYAGKTSVISNNLPIITTGEQVWAVNNPTDVANNIG